MQVHTNPTEQWNQADHTRMSLALQLAEKGKYTARPNPMVGCVIVKDGQIIGSGWHEKYGSAHAEINALNQAGDQARGATCYLTLEPCSHTGKTPPCANALIKAGIKKVIAAMQDPNPKVCGKGFKLLEEQGIDVQVGLMQAQARQINRGFISRVERQRPWVTCKLAMSLDGRTALASGESQWITGKTARADVQKLRAQQDAIITATGTLLADNPSLNVRESDAKAGGENWFSAAAELGFSQPARILLDKHQQANTSANLFNADSQVYWISDKFKTSQIQQDPQHIHRLPSFASLQKLLHYFANKNIGNLLIEAGSGLAGLFLQQQLIDELIIYLAPKIMGNQAKGLFNIDIQQMNATPQLVLKDLRHFDDDIRLTYQFKS